MCPLHRLAPDDLLPGMPLPFAVFDANGKLLFTRGIIIGSVGYLRLLLSRGLYRQSDDDAGSSAAGRNPGAPD